MAKRFGRNQRRRLRAELAHLGAQLEREQKAARDAHASAESWRQRVAYVIDAAARLRYPALLPAESVTTIGDPTAPLNLDASAASFECWPFDAALTERAINMVDLYALSYEINKCPEAFALDVHLFLEGRGKYADRWSYRVSENALRGGLGPDARRRFVVSIARDLLKFMELELDKRGARR